MKRLFASLLTMVALAACASPLAKVETPQQALTGAAQRASQLHSAKFDMQGHVTIAFPPQMAQMFGQSGAAANSTMALDLAGTGEAQFPDRYHLKATTKMGGFSVATEMIVANGKAYIKNPMTGKWQVTTPSSSLTDQLGQSDPLSYDQFLKNVKSIKDLGDTTLGGITVHHYQLTPDKDKLVASIGKVKNAQAAAALKQVLDSGAMTVDVWFGKDDHLVRRLSVNLDYNIDLNQLMGSLGAAAGAPAGRLPAGSTIHAKATVVINYHDFDAPVTISIPTVG